MRRSSGSCQNVSCPVKAVVNLPPTKMDAGCATCYYGSVVHPSTPSSVVQPATTATIAASVGLAGNQFFDVSFFTQQVQEIHNMLQTEIDCAISAKLLPMLNYSARSALPATLQMIRKPGVVVTRTWIYTMAVEYIAPPLPLELSKVVSTTLPAARMLRPCSQAAVLVLSTQKSTISSTSADGCKVVTDNVVDLLHTDSTEEAGAPQKFQIISFARLDNLTDFKLDPPKKGKDQAALITVTGVFDADTDGAERPVKGFLADNVQLLTPEEANTLKAMFRKLLYFATLDGQISRKREREPCSSTETRKRR